MQTPVIELEKLRSLVESSNDLPALPQIWLKVRKITEDLRASAQDVADVILKDQALTTRVLKVANSAEYCGYHQKITTITNAIVLLGFNEVRNIVLGYTAYNMLYKLRKNKQFDFKSFWVHSLATAVAARLLAENTSYELPEEAFVAGLLHDIGKLIASQLLPDEYERVMKAVSEGANWQNAEIELFGVDHQTIGEWAATRWAFPSVLVKAISWHHRNGLRRNEKSQYRIVEIVAVANQMAKMIFRTAGVFGKIEPSSIQEIAHDLLGLSPQRWALLVRQLADQVRSLVDEFHLNQDDLEEYTEFLEQSNVEHARTEKFYEEMNRELTSKVRELNVLHEFSAALLQTSDGREITKLLLESIYRGIDFSRVLFFMPDKTRSKLLVSAGYGADAQDLVLKSSIEVAKKGAIATSFLDGRVVNILNAASPLFVNMVAKDEMEVLRCASFACIPVMVYKQTMGVIVVDNHIPAESVPDHRLSAVVTFANQASLGMQRMR